MSTSDSKADLRRYLRNEREALVWKLDGPSEYDIRRPLTPTGTNLLGLVKHVASVEARYLGATFGRPFGEPLPWFDDDAEPNADMWTTADESGARIVGLYRRVWAHTDATIEALPLDAARRVPWWSAERSPISLHRIPRPRDRRDRPARRARPARRHRPGPHRRSRRPTGGQGQRCARRASVVGRISAH